MPGPVHDFLARDHARLDALLQRAVADPAAVDRAAYEELRAGLLRHIAMEEKVLLAEAKRARGGEPLAVAKALRADHAALASLMVPTPTHEIVRTIRAILETHNRLEEGPGGVYAACEALAGADVDQLLARLHAVPPVKVAAPNDAPLALAHVEKVLRERR